MDCYLFMLNAYEKLFLCVDWVVSYVVRSIGILLFVKVFTFCIDGL